jgi:hypothetical protein
MSAKPSVPRPDVPPGSIRQLLFLLLTIADAIAAFMGLGIISLVFDYRDSSVNVYLKAASPFLVIPTPPTFAINPGLSRTQTGGEFMAGVTRVGIIAALLSGLAFFTWLHWRMHNRWYASVFLLPFASYLVLPAPLLVYLFYALYAAPVATFLLLVNPSPSKSKCY